jgi:phospholipase C
MNVRLPVAATHAAVVTLVYAESQQPGLGNIDNIAVIFAENRSFGCGAAVEADGVTLKVADTGPKSALDGPARFLKDGNPTPGFCAVNTMGPPYQPSRNKPAEAGDPALPDPSKPTKFPPQTEETVGDLLSRKGISWAWYAGEPGDLRWRS